MQANLIGMRSFNRYLLVFLSIVLSSLLCSLLCGCSNRKVILKPGQAAPAFVLYDMKGNMVRIPEDVKGKVAVIRFWSDSCKFCIEEMPKMEKVYKKYADKGMVILAVNVGEDKDAVVKFVNGLNISYTVLLDPGTVVTKRYGVTGLPTTFIIDRDGTIRQKILGETGAATFEEIVLKELKKE
jgi:cytochrome c biogenesis protein CcmG/thiol:disulfide interchange protein DsbE